MDNIKFASTFTSNFESLFLDIDPIMAHPAKTETKVVQAIAATINWVQIDEKKFMGLPCCINICRIHNQV